MTRIEFLTNLNEQLDFDRKLEFETIITETEEWDSMSVLILINYIYNTFDVSINAADIAKITNVDSLIEKIGIEKFDE